MNTYPAFQLTGLPDELVLELLQAFSSREGWSELEHHQQIADKIIRQYLTVEFHAFVWQQISH